MLLKYTKLTKKCIYGSKWGLEIKISSINLHLHNSTQYYT